LFYYLDKCVFSRILLLSHIPLGFVNFLINILFRGGHGLSFALVTLAETFNNPFILHSIIQVVDDSGNQTLIQFKSISDIKDKTATSYGWMDGPTVESRGHPMPMRLPLLERSKKDYHLQTGK
jgi:hypothetical protein